MLGKDILTRNLKRDPYNVSNPSASKKPNQSSGIKVTLTSMSSTGSAVCSRGGRHGFIFTPACFIASEAFLGGLMKGKAAETDGGIYHLPASVPPDSSKRAAASEISVSDCASLALFSAKVLMSSCHQCEMLLFFPL